MKKNSKKWMAGDNDVRMNQQRLSNRQLRGAPVFYQHHPQKRVAKVKDVLADQKRGVILGLLYLLRAYGNGINLLFCRM